MPEVIPIFTSDASLGKSILTTDDAKDIKEDAPISIFSIAKAHNLDKIYIVDNSMVSFMPSYKQANKLGKQLIFGMKFIINSNPSDKSEKSTYSDSNVIVWIKNSAGYQDLIRLYSVINGTPENYFWDRFNSKVLYRGAWDVLQRFVTDNLVLTIPFYDSFLYKNLLTYGAISVPEFGKLKPSFILEDHNLPFDALLRKSVNHYCQEHNYTCFEGHSIYYYKKADVRAFQMLKCISGRTSFEMPNMEYFCQDTFSFESYLERNTKLVSQVSDLV